MLSFFKHINGDKVGFPDGSVVRAYLPWGDLGFKWGSGRSPGGKCQPILMFCLENPTTEELAGYIHGLQRVRHDLETEHAWTKQVERASDLRPKLSCQPVGLNGFQGL